MNFLRDPFRRGKAEQLFCPYRASCLIGFRLIGLLALAICSNVLLSETQPILSEPTRHQLYARATNRLAMVRFVKPAESKQSELLTTLAPLLMQEVLSNADLASTNSGPVKDSFGHLNENNGVTAVDSLRPAIYCSSDSVEWHGKWHARFTYLWFYPVSPPKQVPELLPLQGVRITLDSKGQPVIWEVLLDPSGASLIFIAHSLEMAAAAEFGRPLPGRRHVIERSLDEAPNVVVARVIEDGPVPMGPFVYLEAGTRSVATLICRCMPVQSEKLVSTSVYDLLFLDRDVPTALLDAFRRPSDFRLNFWPGDGSSAERMRRCLRLPKDF